MLPDQQTLHYYPLQTKQLHFLIFQHYGDPPELSTPNRYQWLENHKEHPSLNDKD